MKIHYTTDYMLNPTHKLSVAVAGAGGTGSQVMQCLARIDYALYKLGHPGLQVTLYDEDIVTEANIGRQLFSPTDIGLNKALVIVSRINSFYGVSWESASDFYPAENCMPSNITITCVDNAKARMAIGEFLRKNDSLRDNNRPLYWLDFGNQTDRGQVVLGTISTDNRKKTDKAEAVKKLKCVDQLFNLKKVKEKDSGPSCSLAEALSRQDLFINSTLAQVGCGLLWKLITEGSITHQGAFVNLKNMTVNPIKL